MSDDEETTGKEDALAKATALLQDGKLLEAIDGAQSVLDEDPNQADALYLLAVAQRYLKQYDRALLSIARLKELRPAYGRACQEEAHTYLAQEKIPEAIAAYRHAVSLNKSLIASWHGLARLLMDQGDAAQARNALKEFQKLDALPPELLSVRNMTAEGEYFKAERLCRHFLKSHPRHVEGMRLLADLGVKAGVLDDAEFILESAVEFEPDNRFARNDYMNVLYRRQKYAQALAQARLLTSRYPDNLDYRIAYANQCVAVGDYDPALEIYEYAIKKRPAIADLHLVQGHALKTVGRLDEAIDAYRSAYRVRADFGDAYWSLANLKTYRFTDEEVSLMKAAESAPSTYLDDRIHQCFALGKHLEDTHEFEESARYYERGNSLRRSQLRYKSADMSRRLALQAEHCSTEVLNSGQGHLAADPIFIVGLPRAGSTLLEQILASHSAVDGTHELPNIPALAYRLGGRRRTHESPKYPANLSELSSKQREKFGKAFIDDARVHRAGAPYFIDKMPNNFRHIGLIHLILPNAKIIDARRHPMACCFSGYKQLFASGQEFTYGLREVGQYYHDYVKLMEHWDQVLPGKILRVHYEDVVADLETEVSRVLEHCDLPFEKACVEFHKTERSVRTPSSEQVRQPIYTSGLAQWQNFEPWLGPLKDALGPVLSEYPVQT